jgi:hypothetical protein
VLGCHYTACSLERCYTSGLAIDPPPFRHRCRCCTCACVCVGFLGSPYCMQGMVQHVHCTTELRGAHKW